MQQFKLILITALMILFPTIPVFAHDCSSPSDCENVIRDNAWLATILGGIAGLAALKQKPWKTNRTKKKFKDCKHAVDWLNNQKPNLGETIPKWKDHTGAPKVTPQPDGTFKADWDVTFSLDPSSTMELTDVSWPNMTAAERRAVREFQDALLAHEEGHLAIAKQVLSQESSHMSAEGATAEEAVENLNKNLDDLNTLVTNYVNERNGLYDDVTEHGAKQSNIGGKDIILRCP